MWAESEAEEEKFSQASRRYVTGDVCSMQDGLAMGITQPGPVSE